LAGFTDTGLSSGQTTSGATFKFTLTAAESYSLEILPLGGGSPLATHSGSLSNSGSGLIDSIEILMFENGSGNGLIGPAAKRTGEREFFFNNLRVEAAAEAQSGDYDEDGDTDGADFVLWQQTIGSTTLLAADGNGNGFVEGGDLEVWRSTFGAASTAASGAAQAIPEPIGVLWFLVTAPVLISAGRRRRRGIS
jgi:hypothetical protein